MSRKLLALLVAALLLLSLATYVYYRRTLASVPIDPYALVPDDAVLVLATRDHPALVRHLQEAGVWDNISGVRYFQQVAGQLALADSLDTGGNPSLATRQRRGLLSLLGRKLVLTSVHITGPGQVDVLYQIPLATVREYRQARGLLETLGRDARYTLSTRNYEGYELQELTAREGGGRLTVLNYRNHLLLSTQAALVEAAVQRLQLPDDAPTVRASFSDTDLLRLRDVDATVLLNFRRLPGLLDVLFRPGTHAQLDQAATLARDALLGLKIEPGQLLFTGFANPETAVGSWHQLLRGQPAQPLRTLADVLTLRTALVLAVAGPLAGPPAPAARADSARQQGRAALDSLRAALRPGLTLAYLAAPTPAVAPARLVLARCAAPARAALWLARLRRLAGVSPAFVRMGAFNVYGAGFTAEQLAPSLLPAGPTGTLSAALVRDYLVLGEPAVLQAYLTDVAAGQTWSRSAAQVALLQQTIPQARLTVLADTRQGWNALLGYLAEERRAGLLRNESLLKHFPQVAWQLFPPDAEGEAPLSDPGSQYYAQLVLRRPGQGSAASAEAETGAGTPRFSTALVGQPLLLPAAPDDPAPAVVADSLGVLRLLNSRDNVALWADTLPGPVVGTSPPRLVRGRLLLATAHRLHWLSPTDGQQAPGFPLNLPDSVTIAAVATSPTPRPVPHLLLATTANDLLLLDASGRQFAGWPRRLEAPLAGPPLLLTVGGRDVVVAALRNGYVYAFTQAGERYPGFPVSAGAHLAGPMVAQPAATLARSVLRLVNQHGELLTLTLSGDIASRRRVATWSRMATFALVPEANGRAGAFVVVREDGGQLDVFDPTATSPAALLSRQLLTSGSKPVQWFDFGGGHQVLALTEPGPGQVSLFDGRGRALGGVATAPWPSTGTGVALRYDAARRRYLLVRVLGHELRRDELAVP
jgi:hypothetical protein